MFSRLHRTGRTFFPRRYFGGGGHGTPGTANRSFDLPEAHAAVGKFYMVLASLWVMYMFKEDRGKLFGFYKPWLDHHHDHSHHLSYKEEDLLAMPVLEEHHDHGDEHHDDDHHDDE